VLVLNDSLCSYKSEVYKLKFILCFYSEGDYWLGRLSHSRYYRQTLSHDKDNQKISPIRSSLQYNLNEYIQLSTSTSLLARPYRSPAFHFLAQYLHLLKVRLFFVINDFFLLPIFNSLSYFPTRTV
jgi:hypothetical protein